MFRKDLSPLLLNQPLSVTQIARLTGETGKDIASDLEHLMRSLKHTEFEASITPAICRRCGFRFEDARLRKPSKCPECRSTWLSEPLIELHQAISED